MSAPLPDALRARFQKLVEERLSGRAAALRLKVSPATGAHWGLAIRRTGQARAAPQGRPRGKGKLDPHRGFFAEVIAQDGDIIAEDLGAKARIKRNPSRRKDRPIGWMLYRERHPVECFFNRIKRFRRIALRCGKTVSSFKAFVNIACVMAWISSMQTPPR